ncbi:Coenzyme B12-dependent mutase [Carbonactinospora thermoautotrophica]|uniref:Coenzyme B12-dependent mutase n=1 Tax=Carbonactinospora thermoautotrophica TaxID=1469144 RepID=A0A132MNU5_9ACTN|nr:Coenzyme B12-dependent mutase [Carbonactinospora thermoautotrophica]
MPGVRAHDPGAVTLAAGGRVCHFIPPQARSRMCNTPLCCAGVYLSVTFLASPGRM